MERGGVNNHHVFWQRRWYKTPLEKVLRSHRGLVIPLFEPVHNELHAQLLPPPKPSSRMIMGALEFLETLPATTLDTPPELCTALSEHFLAIDTKVAQRIGQNLVEQQVFIAEGYYHQ